MWLKFDIILAFIYKDIIFIIYIILITIIYIDFSNILITEQTFN